MIDSEGNPMDTTVSESESPGGPGRRGIQSRKGSGSALLTRMIFDKDNPADRQEKGSA
jgi:hypothetical protein